jgi:hypothetical protein
VSTERPDEEVPVMVRDFRGLRVEIGPRVQIEWRKVPIAEKSRLLESALAAWEKHDQSFKYGPMIKVIEERQREKACLGEHWLNYTAIQHRLTDREQIELLNAYYQRDPLALHRIAARWERQKKAAPKRERERFHGLDITLIREWLNQDGLCLAWFSMGALEKLLRKAGLCDTIKTVEGVGKRVKGLGLERLRRPIVRTNHVKVNIGAPTVKIN